jgi:hypothetical protein
MEWRSDDGVVASLGWDAPDEGDRLLTNWHVWISTEEHPEVNFARDGHFHSAVDMQAEMARVEQAMQEARVALGSGTRHAMLDEEETQVFLDYAQEHLGHPYYDQATNRYLWGKNKYTPDFAAHVDYDGRLGYFLVAPNGPSLENAPEDELTVEDAMAFIKRFAKTAQREEGPWIAVDLDGTLLEYEPGMASRDEFGQAIDGAREAMRELKSLGWRISVFTARLTPAAGNEAETDEMVAAISAVLDEQGIPFDDVWVGRKPFADVFVDDRAVRFDGNWTSVLQDVLTEGGDGAPEVEDGDVSAAQGLLDTHDSGNDFLEGGYTRRDISVRRPPEREEAMF